MFSRLYQFFSSPVRLVILNSLILVMGVVGNAIWQVFCIPVVWSIIVLTICFISTVIYPLFNKSIRIISILAFTNGVSFSVFIYCILFLSFMNVFSIILILFFGLGLLTFIPHLFVIQLFRNYILKPIVKSARIFFLLGLFVSFGTSYYFGYEYRKAILTIEKFKESNFTELEKSYMVEKILGMHFIYHTRICDWDGWRPPKHDPILIVGMWYNEGIDPLNLNLEERLELYKQFYPENRTKYDCSCAWMYSDRYHNDDLWK